MVITPLWRLLYYSNYLFSNLFCLYLLSHIGETYKYFNIQYIRNIIHFVHNLSTIPTKYIAYARYVNDYVYQPLFIMHILITINYNHKRQRYAIFSSNVYTVNFYYLAIINNYIISDENFQRGSKFVFHGSQIVRMHLFSTRKALRKSFMCS